MMQADQGYAEAKQASREARLAVLREAEVVVSTLIAAGGDLLNLSAGQPGFNAIIIDEVGPRMETCSLSEVLVWDDMLWNRSRKMPPAIGASAQQAGQAVPPAMLVPLQP